MTDGFQENFFEGVAAVGELADLQPLAGGDAPEGADFDIGGKDDAPFAGGFANAFGADFAEGGCEAAIVADDVELDEAAVGFAFGFEVGLVDDLAVLEDDDFVADLFDVGEEMGAEQDVHAVLLLHFLDELEHALAGGGVEAIGGFVEDDEFGAVDNGLRELGHLFHAERVGADFAVARFAEADVKENFVGFFESRGFGQARDFAHQAEEGDGGHVADERIVFGHVADAGFHFAGLGVAVETEDAGAACGGLVEAEEGLDQRGFAGAVGAQQADGFAGTGNAEAAGDSLENLPPAKANAEGVDFDNCAHLARFPVMWACSIVSSIRLVKRVREAT